MDWQDKDEIEAAKWREQETYLYKLGYVYNRAAEIVDATRCSDEIAVERAISLFRETERQFKNYEGPHEGF